MASRLWRFLNTDIGEMVSLDTVDSGKDAADAVLGLAEVLQAEGPDVQQLASLVTQLDSLLDVLNSPLGKIVGASLPFVSIATGLLKFYLEKTKQEPTLAQSVALVSQAAYLESFKQLVNSNSKLNQWIAAKDNSPQAKVVTPQVKILGDYELADKAARFAMLYFHQSELAIAFNGALSARLVQLGASSETANKISEAVAKNTNRYMREAIADAGDKVKRVAEWYRTGGDTVFEKYLSIDTYLEEWIAPRPHEKVFAEPFTFKDIYVPLKAQPLTSAGEKDESQEPIVLEQWARQMLNDETQTSRVLFVQGGPGRGKSVFCRMFADWVRRYEHPRWTPILIRLRDVSVLSRDFEETLAKAVDRDFAKTDSGWLTDRNVNFLFILDGFDELLMEGRTSGGLDHFLDQVGRFQEQCARNSEKKHRVLITGRTLALQSIESRMPSNLARIQILPMDLDLQLRWLDRWDELIDSDAPSFLEFLQGFLDDEPDLRAWKDVIGSDSLQSLRMLEQLSELSGEPLLLYLLAAMYRDEELTPGMFEGTEEIQSKVLIYERTLEWVLTKQRPEWLNKDLTEIEISGLRRILQEAGLCVVQSGMEFANIRAIEDRLSQDSTAKGFLEEAQKRLAIDDTPLRNALAAFYLQEGRQGEGSIEFVHKSFGEFLCAERIVNGLIDVCQPGRNREYDIEDPAFCWMIYDLLGCHVLTPEIVEYLTALLTKHPDFKVEKLHERLYDFYWRWSEGKFIDAPPETLPQEKMRLLRQRAPDREEALGQCQVEIYTGLNTMILMFELHRRSCQQKNNVIGIGEKAEQTINSLAFHPCKPPGSDNLDKSKLLRIIGRSRCLSVNSFEQIIGPFLNSTELRGADLHNVNLHDVDLHNADLQNANLVCSSLTRANLRSANLCNASLIRTYLISADLRGVSLIHADLIRSSLRRADLRDADLYDADLSGSDLRNTDFRGASLIHTDLRSADLRSADLRGANLSNANLYGATLADGYGTVRWDEQTSWQGTKGLESAIGVPEALKRQLGLSD